MRRCGVILAGGAGTRPHPATPTVEGEIARRNGRIDDGNLLRLAVPLGRSGFGDDFEAIVGEGRS